MATSGLWNINHPQPRASSSPGLSNSTGSRSIRDAI